MDKRTLTDYYEKDVPAYASYDNLRKICGIDGLKLSQRKIIYAAFKRCYSEFLKTDTMCAQTQIDTNYIHGAANLEVVIDNLAANYVGANNYALLTGNSGGFGCRISPRPSCARYTRVKLSDISKRLFLEVDNEILEKQFFEGQYIEPKFLMPVLPIMFLNGSNGMSTGFSNEIQPRNPKDLVEYIKKKLNGVEKPRISLLPWFKGHLGKVVYNSELRRSESFGVITQNNMTSYTISEIPIGMSYEKYVEFLDKLNENGIIQGYVDKCDPKTDTILFQIKTTREFTRKYSDERSLYDAFHLIKSLSETLCCIDENNRVEEFSSIQEILDKFIKLRLEFYQKRKDYLVGNIKRKLVKLASKYYFIQGIVQGSIIVNKRKRENIIAQLEKIEKIKPVDGSYSYLLDMPIYSLTQEKLDELKKQIEAGRDEYKAVNEATIQEMWLADLKELQKCL